MTMPTEAAAMPTPGEELMSRVAGGPDPAAFFWSGRESVRELARTLAIAGRSLESFESILDFGCGCGRMLLWMERLGRERALHGTDIDSDAIAWCAAHIPYAKVTVNQAEPPLPYPDAAFELVFNHSVFTHIDERLQDLWLSELQRVTKPGGLVVLSVHGERALSDEAWELRDELQRHGIVFLDRSIPQDFPLPDWYQNTWHAPWYIFEHWGRWFQIRAYVPGAALDFQDHVLLERDTEAGPSRRPLAARPQGPVEGLPEHRVVRALAAARGYRMQSPVGESLPGRARALLRQSLLRAMRPYTAHEDKFDDAVVTSIAELSRNADQQAAALKTIQDKLGAAD